MGRPSPLSLAGFSLEAGVRQERVREILASFRHLSGIFLTDSGIHLINIA